MTKAITSFIALFFLSVVVMLLFACSKEDMDMTNEHDYRKFAMDFTKELAAREYDKAYAMTSKEYQRRITKEQLKDSFESIVPTDWGDMGPIEVGETMMNWPGKQHSDLGWVYVSIGGDVYSEAITVVVTSENERPKIREVEFGRP
jgi:hypothetical protein